MDMDIYRRIGLACSRIPRGRVATYGQIALLCGKPGNSRQVGYALKKGLAGEDVPAHRVVNAAWDPKRGFSFCVHGSPVLSFAGGRRGGAVDP